MKKIALSLAGVLAAAAFAPEASAVPVFARQTGMACSACHFQHFPLLNGFGRSFKASGYTLMGSQGKVEGEHLSIPAQLNMGVLITSGYETTSASPDGLTQSFGGWYVPTNGGELSIFFGGKVTDNSGFLSELGLGANGTANAAVAVGAPVGTVIPNSVGVPSAKYLFLPEVANNTRAGFAIYSIGQGAAGSFELLNTGATSIHRLMGNPGAGNAHINATSARQFVAPEAAATGVSLIVVNPDVGFLNISKYASTAPGTVDAAGNLPGTYVRAAALFNLAGFDSAVGFQSFSGFQQPSVAAATFATLGEEKATIIDAQMQGEVASMPLGLYASWGKAPSVATGPGFNVGPAGTADRSSFNIAADLGVIPKVGLQAAIRSGNIPGAVLGSKEGDNAFMVGVAYELAMNTHVSLHHTQQSGSSWNVGGVNAINAGKNTTTILLESLF